MKTYAHAKQTAGYEKIILIALIMIALVVVSVIILNSPSVICAGEKLNHLFNTSYVCSLYQVMP